MLAAFEREIDVAQKVLLSRGDLDVLRLDHGSTAPRRGEKVEAEPLLAHGQRLELPACLPPLLLQAADLRQLGLSLLRLALLVTEPFDETLQPLDVDAEAVRGLTRRRGARSLLDP